MDNQNYLGIYISTEDAAVVCVDSQGAGIVGYFSVTTRGTSEDGPAGFTALANLIARGCSERSFVFSEVAVALDCALFMQHSVHSEFADLRQIASTIRFDTEEAIASDVADVAIAFRGNAVDENGSTMSVFTAKQKIISEIIGALQSNNMDPVSVEPDVSCLSRFVFHGGSPQAGTLLAMLSRKNGYFLLPKPSEQRSVCAVRTFLIGNNRNREAILYREIPVTIALLASGQSVTSIKVLDASNAPALDELGDRLSCDIDFFEFPDKLRQISPEESRDADSVELAIAYGAALFHTEKDQSINFRSDFMPFQGGRMLLEKTVQLVGIAAAVLVIALGLFATMRLVQENKPAKLLRKKYAEDYTKVMMTTTMPSSFAVANEKLKNTERRLKNIKSPLLGTSGDKSLPARLTLILDALNKCGKQTDLKVEKISLTERSISIRGNTSSRRNTLAFFEAIKKNNFEIPQLGYDLGEDGRDVFTITVAPREAQ